MSGDEDLPVDFGSTPLVELRRAYASALQAVRDSGRGPAAWAALLARVGPLDGAEGLFLKAMLFSLQHARSRVKSLASNAAGDVQAFLDAEVAAATMQGSAAAMLFMLELMAEAADGEGTAEDPPAGGPPPALA